MIYIKNKLFLFSFFLVLLNVKVIAQSITATSDELFIQARSLAIDKKDYPKAIELLKAALQKSPDYEDIRIYLGRVYTWTDKVDSARLEFSRILTKNPKNAEAISANFDLEFWNNNYSKALDQANNGILYFPDSVEFNIKKAKVLNATLGPDKAIAFMKAYVKMYPNQKDALKHLNDLKSNHTKNTLSTGYEYVHFDKRFNDPWHYSEIDYTRNFSFGSVTGRLNYANRFGTNGLQTEIEAYPSITKNIYAYVGGAYSADDIFPSFRFGTSFYYSLPKSFDAETGIRYLNFSPSKTYIFVLAAGKYIGNYYINLKAYLTPDDNAFSRSFTLSTRYYFSDRFNYLGIQIGTGVSPDDRARNTAGTENLKSYKLGLNYSKDLIKNLTLGLSTLWYYEEYAAKSWGNQFSGGVSISKRF